MTREKILLLAMSILLTCISKAGAGDLCEGYTSTRGIVPVLIRANPLTCTDMVCASPTFVRIEKGRGASSVSDYTGTYALGRSGTLTLTASDDATIAWTADVDINCIFMKGGPGGNSYWYDPPCRSDSGLSTPLDIAKGKPRALSHITICYTPPASDL